MSTIGKFASLQEIKDHVDAQGGIASFKMLDVRDAHGAGRLGVHVRTNISKALRGMGLGHYPTELPDWQEHQVRVYRLGSPTSDLIEAVLAPGSEGDIIIREASSGDAQKTLNEIRELVCQ